MATTSLWRISGSTEKALSQVIEYAKDPEKTMEDFGELHTEQGAEQDALSQVLSYAGRGEATDGGAFITGINCDPEKAFSEMMAVKERFRKKEGTIAYHGYQSFAEGEVSPKQAHRIGVELARNLWGDRYQVLVTTHLDKVSHLHNHFVLNTVSFVDGKKFYRSKKDYAAMREESDRLCRREALSVIERPKAKGVPYPEWSAGKDELAGSVRGMIRKDIDLAISESNSLAEFLESMEGFGYRFKFYRKDGELLERPSLLPPGRERYMRFYKLGSGYDLDSILDRIFSGRARGLAYTSRETQLVSAYWRMNVRRYKRLGLQGLFDRYIFELKVVRKWPHIRRALPMETRAAAVRLASYERQHRLLKDNGIETLSDLQEWREGKQQEMQRALSERQRIRMSLKDLRRGEENEAAEAALSELKEVSEKIGIIRRQLKDAEEIAERSVKMADEVRRIDEQAERYERLHPEPEAEPSGRGSEVKNKKKERSGKQDELY